MAVSGEHKWTCAGCQGQFTNEIAPVAVKQRFWLKIICQSCDAEDNALFE